MNSIQEDYARAKADYDDAIESAGCYVDRALIHADLNYDTAPEELLVKLETKGSKMFNVGIRHSILRDKENKLLVWGWNYISTLDEDAVAKLRTVKGSKGAVVRQHVIENFSKMED